MEFVRFLPHAGIIALLAAALQYVSAVPGAKEYLVPWAIFQTWALYFLAGASPAKGAKAAACYVLGIGAAIAIVLLGTQLTPVLGDSLAFPVAVAVIAFTVILFERVRALDFIPAYFIGAGAFYALNKDDMGLTVTRLLVTVVVGMALGYLTVTARGKYAAMGAPKPAPAQAPEREKTPVG